jgi:hypothetical protein
MGNVKNSMTQEVSSNNNVTETEIEKEALPNFYLSHKKIIATGALTGLLRCRTCGESISLGDLLDQLGKEERIALKERIEWRISL